MLLHGTGESCTTAVRLLDDLRGRQNPDNTIISPPVLFVPVQTSGVVALTADIISFELRQLFEDIDAGHVVFAIIRFFACPSTHFIFNGIRGMDVEHHDVCGPTFTNF